MFTAEPEPRAQHRAAHANRTLAKDGDAPGPEAPSSEAFTVAVFLRVLVSEFETAGLGKAGTSPPPQQNGSWFSLVVVSPPDIYLKPKQSVSGLTSVRSSATAAYLNSEQQTDFDGRGRGVFVPLHYFTGRQLGFDKPNPNNGTVSSRLHRWLIKVAPPERNASASRCVISLRGREARGPFPPDRMRTGDGEAARRYRASGPLSFPAPSK